jgi:hypothetical protein
MPTPPRSKTAKITSLILMRSQRSRTDDATSHRPDRSYPPPGSTGEAIRRGELIDDHLVKRAGCSQIVEVRGD